MVAAANYSNCAAIQKRGEVKTHMLGAIMKSAGGCGHGSGGKRQRVYSVLSARRPPACRDEREPNVHRDESGTCPKSSTTQTLSGVQMHSFAALRVQRAGGSGAAVGAARAGLQHTFCASTASVANHISQKAAPLEHSVAVRMQWLGVSLVQHAGGCGHGSGGKRERVCSLHAAR